jgi:protein-S-isoprenylcysteine O-methyltransferase Ste14
MMIRLLVFVVASSVIVYISRKALVEKGSHGFYRFFAWEAIMVLVLLNLPHWFENPFSNVQLISWLLLVSCTLLVGYGMLQLTAVGKPTKNRSDDTLFDFEKTSTLVTVGLYKYIRHPLYSSLLLLTWGAFLKNPGWTGLFLSIFSTIFLFLTAVNDEKECIVYFGDEYRVYMKRTKRFIPFLL